LQIVLDEKQSTKVKFNQLEEELKKITKSAHLSLSKTESRVEKNFLGKNIYLTHVYELKLNSANQMQEVIKKLKEKEISTISFLKVDYNKEKKEKLERELSIEAIKKAKEKAKVLLEAIGQQMGKAIYVRENHHYYGFHQESSILYEKKMTTVKKKS